MSRVFIIETPTVNVAPAETWGEIHILFPEGVPVPPYETNQYTGYVIEELERQKFNPQVDRFALVGPVVSTAIVVGALISRYKAVKGLIYNVSRNEYALRTLGKWQYPGKWKKGEDS